MKLIRFGLLASLALLSACNSSGYQKTGADGYTFGQKQSDYSQVNVQVTTYTDRKQLREYASKYIKDTSGVMAFSIINPDFPGECHIHMMDPKVSYEPEYVGHEFYHCLYGQWHTNNDSRG